MTATDSEQKPKPVQKSEASKGLLTPLSANPSARPLKVRGRVIESGLDHCVACGNDFGKPVRISFGLKGKVIYASYEGSVLCEDCQEEADLE